MKLLLTLLIFTQVQFTHADELTLTIHEVSLRHGLDPADLLKIAFVENSFRLDYTKRYNPNGTYDIGPFQINSIHKAKLCRFLQIDTLAHNAECAARLVAMHKKKSNKDPLWLARYHSKTPSLKRKYHKRLMLAEQHTQTRLEVLASLND